MKIQELEAVTSWQPSQSPCWDGDVRNRVGGGPGHPCQGILKLG